MQYFPQIFVDQRVKPILHANHQLSVHAFFIVRGYLAMQFLESTLSKKNNFFLKQKTQNALKLLNF